MTQEPTEEEIIRIVRDSMQYVWNDHCDDAGCYPDDIKNLGRGRISFTAGYWAEWTGKNVYVALQKRFIMTPRPQTQEELK